MDQKIEIKCFFPALEPWKSENGRIPYWYWHNTMLQDVFFLIYRPSFLPFVLNLKLLLQIRVQLRKHSLRFLHGEIHGAKNQKSFRLFLLIKLVFVNKYTAEVFQVVRERADRAWVMEDPPCFKKGYRFRKPNGGRKRVRMWKTLLERYVYTWAQSIKIR